MVGRDFSKEMIFKLRCNAWKGPREEYNGKKKIRYRGPEQRLNKGVVGNTLNAETDLRSELYSI